MQNFSTSLINCILQTDMTPMESNVKNMKEGLKVLILFEKVFLILGSRRKYLK